MRLLETFSWESGETFSPEQLGDTFSLKNYILSAIKLLLHRLRKLFKGIKFTKKVFRTIFRGPLFYKNSKVVEYFFVSMLF